MMKEGTKTYLKLMALGFLSQLIGHPIAHLFEGDIKDTIGMFVIFIGVLIFGYGGILTMRELKQLGDIKWN